MRWTRQCRAQAGLQGGFFRERSTGARTDGAAAHLRRNSPDGTRSGKTFGGDGRGRRSRVVLAPRCWCQVLRRCIHPTGSGMHLSSARRRWQESPVTGEREVSRKPSCGESRSDPVEPVVHSCVFCAHDRGCNRHPAFPAPSVLKEGESDASLGRIAPRECGRISSRCLKFEYEERRCFASLPI
jgi:hypothetical protein